MPPKHRKSAAMEGGGKKGTKGGAHGKGKGHHKKGKKKVAHHAETHDEIDDLFPDIRVRFPVEPADIEVNPEHENSYFHFVHENQDVQHVDFVPEDKHLHNGAIVHWVPSSNTTHMVHVPFTTQAEKQMSYEPHLWRFQPEWIEWSTKFGRDLSRLKDPRLPYDLTKIERRSISRCYQMIKQAFEPIPIPKDAYPRETRKMLEGVAEEGEGRPKTPNEVADAAKEGAIMALNEVLRGGGEKKDGSDIPIRKTGGKRRGRRDGSVGRPLTPNEKQFALVEKMESISVLGLFKFLKDRGEKFWEEGILKDPTKSKFLIHLLRSTFPALPNGKFSIRRKSINEESKKMGKAVPKQQVKKLDYLINRYEGEMKELREDDDFMREALMTKKIKHMDELEALNKPMGLHEACRKGEVDVVAEILSPEGKPELVNFVDEMGNPPLTLAIKGQHLNLVRYMLAACKADPNALGIEGNTALHEACLVGNKNIVTLLCNYGAEPTAANVYGETPLHFASRQGDGDIVECLILYGAHVDVFTLKGKYTPLMFAAGAGKGDAIKHLLDHGADPSLRNLHWQNAMMRAHMAGHDDAVSAIVNFVPGDVGHNKKKIHGKKNHGKGNGGGKGRRATVKKK